MSHLFWHDETNNIGKVLAKPLLWACMRPGFETFMSHRVRERVQAGYETIRGNENPANYNPIAHVPLNICWVEGQLCIDELLELDDGLGADGGALQQAAAIQGRNDMVQQLVQQVHQLRQSLTNQQQMLWDEISQLRTFITQQFGILGRNVDRLAIQAPRQHHIAAAQVQSTTGSTSRSGTRGTRCQTRTVITMPKDVICIMARISTWDWWKQAS